jgi:uncharacterized Zn-binding protein involved in type VI secretion
MFPAARVTDSTVTGDLVLPPGVPNVLIGGLPAACVGDMVAGPVINYAPGVIVTGAFTVLIGGRPAARVTSVVNGLTIGPLGVPVPVATTIIKGQPNVLIGDMGATGPMTPPPDVQAKLDAMSKEVEKKKKEQEEKEKNK